MFALNSVFFLMVIIIMSIFFIYSVNNLPLGPPLNERNPPEISWQAWLIMDNNNQKNDDNNDRIKFEEEILLNHDGVAAAPKRRIVPKSIFTVPPRIDVEIEDLPPCDSKTQGCVQIIKINESEQIEFMLNQLIGTGPGVDYDTIFNPSDSEPTRVDLFNGGLAEETFVNDNPVENNNGSEEEEEEEEEEIDMAFILTPVLKNNADKTITDNNSKLTGKRKDHEEEQEDLIEDELKKLPNSAAAASTTTTEDATTTTTIDSTTTRTTTEEEELTTITESSSLSTEAEETTTLIITTTDSPLAPSTTEAEQLIETTTTTTTIPKATETTTYHPPMMATTYHPEIDLQAISNKKIRTLVKFPEENLSPRSYPSAAASAAADTGNLVRFPDIDTKVQEESSGHHTRNVDQQTHVGGGGGGGHHYFNEIATPTSSFAEQYRHYPSITEENKFAHINNNNNNNNNRRIKWPNLEEYRKPLLRRSIPMDDLTYLFGYKNGHPANR